jgi:segregation and condensation protein B
MEAAMSGQGSPERSADLGLEQFAAPSDELGLSLEELSEAYASLLAGGTDPYAAAPPADGEPTDELSLAELEAELAAAGTAGAAGTGSSASTGAAAGTVGAAGGATGTAAASGDRAKRGDGPEPANLTSGASSGGSSSSGSSSSGSSSSGSSAGASAASDPYGGFVAVSDRLPAGAEAEISPRTILEAMLFVGHPQHEPLTASHVASLMRGVRPAEIDELVVELNETYAAEQCAYWIESVGAGYRLVLRPEFAPLRDRFYGRVKEAKLSQQAIDVLALVAYNQPLTQAEIDRLRNAASGGVLAQLVRRGLLRVERPDRKPREPIFHTTDKFLELFGLESLDDLPQSQDPER